MVFLLAAVQRSLASAPVRQDWVVGYNGSANSIDNALAIAVDRAGNTYVTGEALGSTYDFVTITYDARGREVWIARYDGGRSEDYATAIALDSDGHVYVTGSSRKLSPDGSRDLDSGSTDLINWAPLTNFVSATGVNQFTDSNGAKLQQQVLSSRVALSMLHPLQRRAKALTEKIKQSQSHP